MNLRHLQKLEEDDATVRFRDTRDGSVFRVAKAGLSDMTRAAIVQHFADGGLVRRKSDLPGNLVDQVESEAPLRQPLGQSMGQAYHPNETSDLDLVSTAPVNLLNDTHERLRGAALGTSELVNDAVAGPLSMQPYRHAADAIRPAFNALKANMQGAARAAGFTPDATTPVRAQADALMQGPQGPMAMQDTAAQNLAGFGTSKAIQAATPMQGQAPPPTAGAPGMPGAGAGNGLLNEAIGVQKRQASLQEKQAADVMGLQQHAEQIRQQESAKWEQRLNDNQARADKLQQDIASGSVDPSHWWKSRSLGGSIAAGISLVLGGIGQAFGGGPNQALEVINKHIERDIDSQKTELGKKQNLLTHYIQQGHDLQSARQLAIADSKDALAGQLQMVASKYAGPEAQLNAQKAIVGLKKDAAATRAHTMQQALENALKLHKANTEDIEAQAKMAAAGGANKVPAKEVSDIAGAKSASDQVEALDKLRKKKANSWYSGATQYLPGTDAAQYRDAQKLAAQATGLVQEEGKLSDADKPFYVSLTPSAGDSEERATAKKNEMQAMLARKASRKVEALNAAGFNTGNLGNMARGPATQNQQRIQLLQWATANRGKDPDADRALKLLGVP